MRQLQWYWLALVLGVQEYAENPRHVDGTGQSGSRETSMIVILDIEYDSQLSVHISVPSRQYPYTISE